MSRAADYVKALRSVASANGVAATGKWTVYSANTEIEGYERALVDTSENPVTIKLSNNINTGTTNWFADYSNSWSNNNLVISGNGNQILGTNKFTVNVKGQGFSLVFNGTQWVFGEL